MWNTSLRLEGDKNRTLEGGELALFRQAVHCFSESVFDGALKFDSAIRSMKETIEDGGYVHNSSLPTLFANMPLEQQLIALAYVTNCLSDPSIEAPELAAWNEATVAAAFECLKSAVEVEIDMCAMAEEKEGHHYFHRRFVLDKTPYEADEDEEEDFSDLYPLSPECDDFEKWDFLIEQQMDYILWDRDYEMTELSDANVIVKAAIGGDMGIDKSYFSAVPINDTLQAVCAAVRYLLQLGDEMGKEYTRLT